MPLPTTVKLGAFCPTLISGPTRVIGFPRIVTAPLRSSAMSEFSLGDDLKTESIDESETSGVELRGKGVKKVRDLTLPLPSEGEAITYSALITIQIRPPS